MFLHSLIEKAMNRYISLDPETASRLKTLSGKVVNVKVLGLPISADFQIHLTPQGLRITDIDEHISCDTEIQGTLINLAALGLSSSNQAVLTPDVIIKGNIALGQSIHAVLKAIEIDWEGQLARFMGNIPAHSVGNIARKTKALLKNTLETAEANVSEYLQEEIQITPSRIEVNDFLETVDTLRDDVERLFKRIELLESQSAGEALK